MLRPTPARRLHGASSLALGAALALLAAGCTGPPPTPTAPASTSASGPVATATASPTPTALAQVAAPSPATPLVEGDDAADLTAATSRALFTSSRTAVVAGDGDAPALETAAERARSLGVPLLLTGPAGADEVRRLGARVLPVGGAAGAWASAQGLDAEAVVAVPASSTGTASGAPPASTASSDTASTASSDTASTASSDTASTASSDAASPTASAATTAATTAAASTAGTTPSASGTATSSDPGGPNATGPASSTVVLTTGDATATAAVATARAAGAAVRTVPGGDPRADGALVTELAASPSAPVLALGGAFGPADRLAERLAAVRTGAQVPGGGQLPLHDRRLVALYGHPGTPSLGVLGEQDLPATIERARATAAPYDGLGGLPAVPALEVIATTASADPGRDGDYSNESDPADLLPYVQAAAAAGQYVVLDLQPGRADLLDQAKRYQSLLEMPGVGLALDPEWHLGPGQRPLQQIGSVDVDEVNRTSAWLADLVRDRALPQKLLLVHQFRLSMVRGRERLDTSRDELQVVLHVDGSGGPEAKLDTYRVLTAGAPAGVVWGWKNFYDEDVRVFTPQETVAVSPSPAFVSYQ